VTGPDIFYGAGIVNARNSLTQRLEPPAQVYVHLYDATTGVLVASQQAQAGGSFTFNSVPAGSYFVFAGEDENGDGLVGIPGRRWSAYGGAGSPTPVVVNAGTGGTAFFGLGYPAEAEPNDTRAAASRLEVDGWIDGTIAGADLADIYRVDISTAGQYTFETSGWNGAFCAFALDLNTIVSVTDAGGTSLGSNDDILFQTPAPLVGNRCSRVTLTLSPGTYYATITAGQSLNVGAHQGRYRLQIRSGP